MEMKIIEAMKELKLIEKKIVKNTEAIALYSSGFDVEKPAFETEAKQRDEVQSLVQSNEDLLKRYAMLKAAIDKTNLVTTVSLMGTDYTIHNLLVLKRKAGELLKKTYMSLNTSSADMRKNALISGYNRGDNAKVPVVIRYFDEKKRNEKLNNIDNFLSAIDARLEVVNAVTNLVDQIEPLEK